jgi:EAL domain-containing protein (putative c-di-GMP-specific phosphodiesterase class I)
LRRADIALYEAKSSGRGRWCLFDVAADERAMKRLAQDTELRLAVERGEFDVYYQPVVNLRSGQIDGLEALIRWHHPDRGLTAPDEFITLANETGLIVPLSEWVLEEACRQASIWQQLRPESPPYVSVNVSPRQFRGPGLGHLLWRVLGETGLAPNQLVLEVTEEALSEDPTATGVFLRTLRALGIRLALDDFGVGYSSLGRLRELPLDELKVDRSFIASLGTSTESAAIVRAVANLAHDLGLSLTAEGIETDEQRQMARDLGCDRGQGFFFAEPMRESEVAISLGTTELKVKR